MAHALTWWWNARVGLTWGVLGVLAPGALAAQLGGATGIIALEERQNALAQVPTGQIIRLRLGDGGHAAGPVIAWRAHSVTLGPLIGYAERDTQLELANIDTLWLRGSATRRGALYGGAGGFAFGAALGATTSSFCPARDGPNPCARGTAASAVAGVIIGGLAGALFGAGTPQWHLLHPRRGGRRYTPPAGQEIVLEAPGDPSVTDARTLALARVRPGALVRLEFADRPDMAGFVIRAGARRAAFAPLTGATVGPGGQVSLASLEEVWERGTARRAGAMVGVLLGVGVVTFATADCRPGDGCGALLLLSGALGGLGGGVLGTGIGSRIPRWHRRF